MADVWEKDLAQKSTLTTSDFIRVVGSDNVSYKQRLSDVSDKVLSTYPSSLTVDVLAWAEGLNGFGITRTNGNSTNLPSGANKYGVAWCNNYVAGTVIWCNLFYSPSGATDIYVCQKSNTSAWTAWEKMPTRAEVDDLNSKFGTATDCNTIPTTGLFLCTTATLNTPVNKYGLLISWAPRQNQALQQFIDTSTATIYTRQTNSSNWTAWQKAPTREEIDALNSKTKQSIVPIGGTYTLPLENGKAYLISMMTTSDTSGRLLYIARYGSYIIKQVLYQGTYQSYYTETVANNEWSISNIIYSTALNILEF